VTRAKIENGTNLVDGEVLRWDGNQWQIVSETALTVTEVDGIIGNEVTDVTDATLLRSGSGTNASPYTLGINADGVTNTEIADNAIQTENILSGGNDKVLVTDGTGTVNWLDQASLNPLVGDGITIVGDGTTGNEFKVIDGSIKATQLGNGSVLTDKIGFDQVEAKNLNPNVAGDGLVQDGSGALEVLVDDTTIEISTVDNKLQVKDEAITPAKLEDGTADGQILQWDATASSWERVTMPTIYAAGKVDGTGTVGFDSEYTVSGNTLGVEREGAGPGSYLISWNTALPDNNYIIQLSIPSSGGTGNDDFDISYRNQSIIGFIVEVGDNDNGGSNRDPRDSEFMFTVIKLPN
jgi:hypothetical protein